MSRIKLGVAGLVLWGACSASVAADTIVDVVEMGGDNEATDTITAKWSGVTWDVTVDNEPVPGATVGTSYTAGLFGNAAPAFVDRNHRYLDDAPNNLPIPEYLVDGEYIMSGNDNRDNVDYRLDVTIAVPAAVYMLIDNRLGSTNADPPLLDETHMRWIIDDGWSATTNGLNRAADPSLPDEVPIDEGADDTINQYYSVYQKDFAAGTFSLFQADNAGQNMYGVVVIPTLDPTLTPGDFNSDGIVDLADFGILASNMNLKFPISESFSKGDNNRDTRVDLEDFLQLRQIYSALPQGVAASVPEPTGITLAALAFLALGPMFRRRRRWMRPERVIGLTPLRRHAIFGEIELIGDVTLLRRDALTVWAAFCSKRSLQMKSRQRLMSMVARCAATLLTILTLATTNVRAELVGYWPLNGTLDDISGQGNSGTAVGDPIFVDDVPAALGGGQSIELGGADAVDLGNPAILNFGTNDWTISAWAKKLGGSDRGNIYSNGGDNGGGIRSVLAIGETGGAQALVLTTDVDQGDGAKVQATSTAAEDGREAINTIDDEWNHVVGMRAGDEIRVYLNGELADTSPLRTDPPYDLSGMSQVPSYIGVGADAASSPIGAPLKWFTGKIDDLAIWDEALDDSVIQFLYEGGSILGPPGDPGDFNLDGNVDTADFTIMAENFNQRFDRSESYEKGDFDLNTVVNLKDFVGFREVFGAQQGPIAAVPEPNTLILYVFGGVLLLAGRRRMSIEAS